MKNNYAAACDKAIASASNTLTSTRPKLEKPFPHCSRVWHFEIGSELGQEFYQPRVIGQNADRPAFYFGLYPRVEVLNFIRYKLC